MRYFAVFVEERKHSQPACTCERGATIRAAEPIYVELRRCERHVWETEMFHKPNHVTLPGNLLCDGWREEKPGRSEICGGPCS